MKVASLVIDRSMTGVTGLTNYISSITRRGCDIIRDRRVDFKAATEGLESASNLGKSAKEISKELTVRSNECVREANALYHLKLKIQDVYAITKECDNMAAASFNNILDNFQCMEYTTPLTQTAEVTDPQFKAGDTETVSSISATSNDTTDSASADAVTPVSANTSGAGIGSRIGTAGTDGKLKVIDGTFYTATGKNGGQSANLDPKTQEYIYNMCQETGMDYPLAFAMWYCESTSYESLSRNKGGTMGLKDFYVNKPNTYTTFRSNYGEQVDNLIDSTWKKTYGEGSTWDRNSYGEGTVFYDMAVSQATLMTSYSYKGNMYDALDTYCGGSPSTRFKIANELRAQMGWEQVDYETVMRNTPTQNNFM